MTHAPIHASLRRLFPVLFAVVSMLWFVAPARAQAVEDFYRGKTLRIVIGYAAGGGYDIYGRIFAEFMSRFIPGAPAIIPQNMPGGGSFVAAKYLYNVAPRDGTYFGSVSQTLALDAAMNEDVNAFDVRKLSYIGRMLDNVDVGIATPAARFKRFDDVRQMEIVVGATGGTSPGFLVPAALQKYAGARFRIVSGYPGSPDIFLAAERGEVDLVGSVGLTYTVQRNPAWVKEHQAPVLYQTALKRHPMLSDVPTIGELATSDEGRSVLRAIAASSDIGRSVVTTPNVPRERLTALRVAFQAMLADRAFQETMKAREIPVFGATGEDMDAVTQEVMKTPPATLEKIKALLKQ